MFFAHTARVGYIEKAIDIYYRRGAENSMLNLQHRLFFRLYENRQQLSDQA